MQPALGCGFVKHGLGGIAEAGHGNILAATEHVFVVEPNLSDFADGFLHFGAVELEFILHPLVIVFWGGGAQHHFFDPVGEGPASGCTRFDTNAPRRVAVFLNLLLQSDQFGPSGWHFIASLIEGGLWIPHQALAIHALPYTAQLCLAIFIDHGCHIKPALAVVLLQEFEVEFVTQILHFALGNEACHKAGLWEVGDVWGLA